jgi:beta-catenin-like protein 1
MNITAVRRLLLRFERAEKKNQDQRSKYPDDPTKYVSCTLFAIYMLTPYRFIDSEADLDLALKALLPLSQAPSVAYPELVSSGAVSRLIGLLSHENVDIVIDVVEVIHELTDEDVGNEEEDEDEEEGKREESLKILMEGLVGLYLSVPIYGFADSGAT